ncbi:LysR family transcriptional regulator [Pontibacterium granulatum]|nr:LysR family transcriptional regulator [Pontibacterium granulatum]
MHLVKTNHFTRTAEQLYMTQPGVSQHIKKLEEHLGTPLLHRFGKSFELTDAGELLYQFGVQQAEAETELQHKLAGDDPHTGECRLACSGSMAMQLYPNLLELQKRYGGLTFSVEAAPKTAIIERIKNNHSDFGIVTQPVNDPLLDSEHLGKDTLCLVVPQNTEASWNSLQTLGFINHPDGHHYASRVLETNYPDSFRGMGQIPESGYINQLGQILLPVAKGLGFTVIPKSSLDAFPFPDQLQSASLPVSVEDEVFLITKKHRPLPKRYQLIRELLIDQWL